VKQVTGLCAQVLAHGEKILYWVGYLNLKRLLTGKNLEFVSLLSSRSRMQCCWRIFAFLVALFCGAIVSAQDSSKKTSDPLTFVRQFSSAQDVKRTHPVLNKTLDIVAGPKDETQTNDVLQSPRAIAADSEKRVFVLDAGSHAIHVFDFARGKYSLLQAEDRMQSPAGIAADQQGTLYVTDKNTRSVLVFDPRGKFSRELMKTHGNESYFEVPGGIAIHRPSGRLYVCDGPRSMVIILDQRGKVLGHIGKRGGGRGPGEFRNPVQVAVAGDEVVVLDAGNSRFQVFDLKGRFRRETPTADAETQSGLAVDSSQNVYITDGTIGQIEVFGPDGRPLYRFGQTGQEDGQLNGPEGLWIESGCLYVADSGNKRVQEFRINGQSASGACQ
jgi:DNA-binding beta-propeller fold protein YncE